MPTPGRSTSYPMIYQVASSPLCQQDIIWSPFRRLKAMARVARSPAQGNSPVYILIGRTSSSRGVGSGHCGVLPAMRKRPDKDASLWLLEMPANGLLGLVMPTAQWFVCAILTHMTETKPRAVIYTRQSLDKNGDGAAVARQLADCERLAAGRKWTVI